MKFTIQYSKVKGELSEAISPEWDVECSQVGADFI